jgi:putative addiction module component (TIGR02574 family)
MERIEKILAEVLALPREARAALAAQLLKSIDDDGFDDDAERAWTDEIERRIQDIDTGRVQTVPWDETEKKLRAIIDAASKT